MKKFTLEYTDTGWRAEFEVDVAKAAQPCRDRLEAYFPPAYEPEDATDLAAVEAYLLAAGPDLIELSIHNTLEALQLPAELPEYMVPMDGSTGIRLVKCEEFEFDFADFALVSGEE